MSINLIYFRRTRRRTFWINIHICIYIYVHSSCCYFGATHSMNFRRCLYKASHLLYISIYISYAYILALEYKVLCSQVQFTSPTRIYIEIWCWSARAYDTYLYTNAYNLSRKALWAGPERLRWTNIILCLLNCTSQKVFVCVSGHHHRCICVHHDASFCRFSAWCACFRWCKQFHKIYTVLCAFPRIYLRSCPYFVFVSHNIIVGWYI